MNNWRRKIKIKDLLTDSEEHKDIQESMNKITNVLDHHNEFRRLPVIHKMRNIPKGDNIISASDYANKCLDIIYDIADEERIWLE